MADTNLIGSITRGSGGITIIPVTAVISLADATSPTSVSASDTIVAALHSDPDATTTPPNLAATDPFESINEALIWITNYDGNDGNLVIPKWKGKTTYKDFINLPITNEDYNKVSEKCRRWYKCNICDVKIRARADHSRLFTLCHWNEHKQPRNI